MKKTFIPVALYFALISPFAYAQVTEIEANNNFADAQNIPTGELVVTGELGTGDPAETIISLNPQNIDGSTTLELIAYSFGTANGLAPNTTYVVQTVEPEDSGAFDELDTVIGQYAAPYSPGADFIKFDDDGGDRRLSSFEATTDASGNLFLAVSGFTDTGVLTETDDQGSFGLEVTTLGSETPDFFRFTGLNPSLQYTVNTSSNGGDDVDTRLAWVTVDELLADNDDFGESLFSQIVITPDANGEATIVVTGSDDTALNGGYNAIGSYRLTLSVGTEVLLGDANLDGVVDFLDITPFITLLTTNDFLAEADINGDGAVTFLDITPLIDILTSR